jgi:nucleotide-binding universal stress UspA family protein
MYERILVPLDGSDLAQQVLPHVEPLAEKLGSTLILVRAIIVPGALIPGTAAGAGVVAGPIVDPAPIIEADRLAAAGYLAALADRLQVRGFAVEPEQAEGSAHEVIVERAIHHRVGLIAMTTHGRGGLGRLVFGSVADAVLRAAPCPVLLVRASQASGQQA